MTSSEFYADLKRDIYGETSKGEFGIRYQIDYLNTYGLKAVFFVEAFFGSVVGLDPLHEVVETIQSRGHDVQLHIHTEWLKWMKNHFLQEPIPEPFDYSPRSVRGQHIRHFTLDQQILLVGLGIQNLRKVGVKNVTAFRAGNFGANLDTLRALATHGIFCDTSYNVCYLESACGLQTNDLLLQPAILERVCEFPVTCFQDWPGHFRPAQINACSSSELRHALLQAWERGWEYFVIVTHSFELLNSRKDGPDRIVANRFKELCKFLADNRDKFCTSTFSEAISDKIPSVLDKQPLKSNMFRTARRFAEQAASRWLT